MNEYDRAREAIATALCKKCMNELCCVNAGALYCHGALEQADAILSLPMICVRADEQSCSKTLLLGGNSYHLECLSCGLSAAQFIHALHDEGFVRIAKREQSKI